MHRNNNVTRRRPYHQNGELPTSAHQPLSSSVPCNASDSTQPAQRDQLINLGAIATLHLPLSVVFDLDHPKNRRLIQEQAVSQFGITLPAFLDHYQNNLPNKRPRPNSNLPMHTPFFGTASAQDDAEKTSLALEPSQGGAPSSGWISDGFQGCFSNFGLECSPCSSSEPQSACHEHLPTAQSYPHNGAHPTAMEVADLVAAQHHGSFDLAMTMADATDLFSAIDTPLLGPYMPQYPIMEPTRIGAQPTSREGMIYPAYQSSHGHLNPSDNTQQPVSLMSSVPSSSVGLPLSGHEALGSICSQRHGIPIATQQSLGTAILPNGIVRHQNVLCESFVKAEAAILDTANHPTEEKDFRQLATRRQVGKRGPFKDQTQRDLTAGMRKIGSCIRCRMQRIRCISDLENPSQPCRDCRKVCINSKGWHINCERWKITDVKLYKPGQVETLRWTHRWKDNASDDVGTWASPEIKKIRVTEGYTGHSVELDVREFRAESGDKTERSWFTNGQKHWVAIPTWAIVDMQKIKPALEGYIQRGLSECCERLIKSWGPLMWKTYGLAMHLASDDATDMAERFLLGSMFRLWTAIRMSTKSFEIVGTEKLGMSDNIVSDEASPMHGKIPIPPVMGAQIDQVLIHEIQAGLRHITLIKLQAMTTEKKPRTWLTLYLVTFILLHNVSLIIRHDMDYATKHGLQTRFARENEVKEYHLGANILLVYFHYCNRNIFPFSDECNDQDLLNRAELDEAGHNFVKDTRQYVTSHMSQWEQVWAKEAYEHDFYYVGQLFEKDWRARNML